MAMVLSTLLAFFAAVLLFSVEPMVARALLPVAGGGASVWVVAVAFFQCALLAGYLYAHLLHTHLSVRWQIAVHGVVAGGVVWAAPLTAPPTDLGAADPWTVGVALLSMVGPAFILLAATSPLLHRWLAAGEGGVANDPYALYAASNAGSFVALFAYALGVEPTVGLVAQRHAWNLALWGVLGLGGLVGLVCWRGAEGVAAAAAAGPPAPWRERLRWITWSLVPSSLLVSVTQFTTTEVAALPLLWVIPLALYLASFVLAFGRGRTRDGRVAERLQPLLMVMVGAELFLRGAGAATLALAPVHLAAFFVTAWACHGGLAAGRPEGRRATEFYLWLAVGGAAGGVLTVVVGPWVFDTIVEYPLVLAAAAFLRRDRPAVSLAPPPGRRPWWPVIVSTVALVVASGLALLVPEEARVAVLGVGLGVVGLAAVAAQDRHLVFGATLTVLLVGGVVRARLDPAEVWRARSFYGTHRVEEVGGERILFQGKTRHGVERVDGPRGVPAGYYGDPSPIGEVLAFLRGWPQRRRVGVVGLGVGALAGHADRGEDWVFFELDPVVVDLARGSGLFSFLPSAHADVEVILGDARRTLEQERTDGFGVLVLDAFSSDSVPVHLLTTEAMGLYDRVLADDGVLAVHVSNRYLALAPRVAAAGRVLDYRARERRYVPAAAEARASHWDSHWLVLTRSTELLARLDATGTWRDPAAATAWTDDRSSVLEAWVW